jgi:alpha-L-fucosidase 2
MSPSKENVIPLRRRTVGAAVALLACAATAVTAVAVTAPNAAADTTTANHALRIVQQYQGVWTSPPTTLSNGETTDAPLLGNGDVGIAIGGPISNQTFYVGKNDFFSGSTHGIKPLGRVVVAASGLSGSSYNVVQDITHAEVRGTYTLGGQTLATTSWMDANAGLFVTSFTLTGGSTQSIGITLQNGAGGTPTASNDGRVLSADVQADTGGTGDPRARMAARTIGGTQSISGNRLTLSLAPGTTSILVVGVQSSIDSSGYQANAVSMVTNLTQQDVSNHNASHRSWWQNFWSQSFVEIPDKAIEKSWYGSLYLLGSASRNGKFAPGLWGDWITGNMNWNGDYHTNYNYETPFYAALSTNHLDQAGAYDRPVLDWQTRGQQLASQNGFTGVLYPVGISPGGTSADTSLHNQKSNAANLASDMVMRFEYTWDTGYANTVYPWLKQVGLFWQNYLTWDGSRYVITNDAPHEDQAYPQTNSSMSLGLVHLLLQGLVDMSTALNVDSGTRAAWQNILSHLSTPATFTRNGQTVVRETEVGSDFVDDGNDIGAQFIYPGGLVGLDSSAGDLQNARNTIGQLTNAWHGGNAPATFYAAAARVGYNPSTILSNLHTEAANNSYPNMHIHHNGGGIENLNVTASGVAEMLVQSAQNDVKVFADWPSGTNAKFGDLPAYGGFLVSSDLESNAVQYLRLVSQKGRSVTLTNPWPGQSLALYRNGTSAGTVSGSKITLTTSAGEVLHLAPAGTSYAEILRRMDLALGGGGGGGTGGPTFYPDANYGGTGVSLGTGDYDLPQLQAAGIANDTISSIRVPAGYTVTAYADSGFSGTSWVFTADNPNLANTGNNDAISSLRIATGGGGSGSVSLRAHANNNIVTADNAGASPLIANRTAIGTWEQFDLINNPDGSVSLRAHANNNIVTADNAGASPLIANRTAIGGWEEFDLINNPDGSVSLRAHANNNIVTADNAGANPLIANRTAIGPWEEFDLIHN